MKYILTSLVLLLGVATADAVCIQETPTLEFTRAPRVLLPGDEGYFTVHLVNNDSDECAPRIFYISMGWSGTATVTPKMYGMSRWVRLAPGGQALRTTGFEVAEDAPPGCNVATAAVGTWADTYTVVPVTIAEPLCAE